MTDHYAKNVRFDANYFAICVKERRGDTSVREIGELIGVSGSTISRIERCISGPDIYTFGKLCGWMRLDPRLFFYEKDETE